MNRRKFMTGVAGAAAGVAIAPLVSVSEGGVFVVSGMEKIGTITIDTPNVSGGSFYDVYCYYENGTLRLATAPSTQEYDHVQEAS